MEREDKGLSTIFTTGLFIFLTIIMLIIALLNKFNGLIILCLAILLTVYAAKAWSKHSSQRIECRLTLEKTHFFVGEEVPFSIQLKNNKFLPIWARVYLNLKPALDQGLVRESGLLWYQEIKWQEGFIAPRRGCYQLSSPLVMTGDPFGFFHQEMKQTRKLLELIIYPRIIPVQAPVCKLKEFQGAKKANTLIEDPVYLLGTRDYHAATPARKIHWKASVRRQKLQEKVFQATGEENILLLIELSSFLNTDNQAQAEENFEKILEVTASLAIQYESQGFAIGLLTNASLPRDKNTLDGYITPGRNPHQISLILETLARIEMAENNEFNNYLEQSLPLFKNINIICLLGKKDVENKVLKTIQQLSSRDLTIITAEEDYKNTNYRANFYNINQICLKEG